MLGAVTFGHTRFQPVIQAIIELAEHAAKEPWPLPEPSRGGPALAARVDALARASLTEAYKETQKQVRQEQVAAAKQAALAALTAEGLDADKAKAAVQGSRSRHRPQRHPRHRPAHRRPRHQDRAPDRRRGRRAAARARQRAVHPRRDAGAVRGHARHRRRTSRSSTRWKASTASTSCCTTISRRIRWARPAAWAARAGARSATASSPGAPSIRCCRRRTSSRTRCAWSARSPRATAAPRWRRSAAARSR